MNEVSWKRILQRAGDEFPAEGEVSYRRSYAHTSAPGNSGHHPGLQSAAAHDFERDLRRALEKAASQHFDEPLAPPARAQQPVRQNLAPAYKQQPARPVQQARMQPPVQQPFSPPPLRSSQLARPVQPQQNASQRRTVYPQSVTQTYTGTQAVAVPVRNLPVPVSGPRPYHDHPPVRRRSGMRNFMVISVSTAVLAFSVHEMAAQWHNVFPNGSRTTVTADASSPMYTGSTNTDAAPAGISLSAMTPVENDAPSTANGDKATQRSASEAPQDPAFRQEVQEAANALRAENVIAMASADAEGTSNSDSQAALPPIEEQVLMHRATALLEQKDIKGARQLLEYLANRRSAVGAFSLARTYDAKFLKSMSVIGVKPDPELARKWYKVAADLGNGEARDHLKQQTR